MLRLLGQRFRAILRLSFLKSPIKLLKRLVNLSPLRQLFFLKISASRNR